MKNYFFNRDGDSNKVHEVHTEPPALNCPTQPTEENRKYLDMCADCWTAFGKAQIWLNNNNRNHIADGCKYCCPECHTM